MRTLEQILSAWSLQGIHVTRKITIYLPTPLKPNSVRERDEERSRIVIYRDHFHTLLAAVKPLRDQCIILLSVKQGFRTGEVGSFRAEYPDYARGDITVLDSKKHKLFTLPMDTEVALRLSEYSAARSMERGFLFTPETRVGRPSKHEGLSETNILLVYERNCDNAGIPRLTPREARAYFAFEELHAGATIEEVMFLLRHEKLETTQQYIKRFIDYPYVKERFMERHCRMFQNDKIEVKT